MIEVFIADENDLIRKGLREILTEDGEIDLVGESSDTGGLMTMTGSVKCDILVLGLTKSGLNEIENVSQIKRIYPDVKLIVLTIDPDETIARRIIKEGASGYVKKDTVSSELLPAVKLVSEGGVYVTPAIIGSDHSVFYNRDAV